MPSLKSHSRSSAAHLSLLSICLLALGLTSCTRIGNSNWSKLLPDTSATKSEKERPGKQRLDVAGIVLGESQELSLVPKDMLTNVGGLLDNSRFRSASRWIARHPEAALETLRQSGSLKADPRSMLAIARVQDRQSLRAAAGATWEQLLKNRSQDPKKFAEVDEGRTQMLAAISQGKTDEALDLNLPKLAARTGEALLEIDAWQLEGTALLVGDRPKDAATAWQKAIALAEPISDFQTAYLRLLLSDAERRSGDVAKATETWNQSVAIATSMIAPDRATYDPVLWERLSYMRPIDAAWPEAAVRRLHEIDPIPGLDLAPTGSLNVSAHATSPAAAEAALWNNIGKWYLDRGHHQAALVAFKRVESALAEPVSQHYMRLRQARALILLDQSGAATAILLGLASDKLSKMTRPAMGMLGSQRLQTGNVQQGLSLLRKAVEKDETFDWPERAEAEADLGLAWLIVGDEKQGLKWVHQAQQRFEARGDFESLSLSLQNEAEYLAHAKKRFEATAIRDRLAAMERE